MNLWKFLRMFLWRHRDADEAAVDLAMMIADADAGWVDWLTKEACQIAESRRGLTPAGVIRSVQTAMLQEPFVPCTRETVEFLMWTAAHPVVAEDVRREADAINRNR